MKSLAINRSDILIFLFSLAIFSGPSYSIMDEFSYSECNDCHTYLALARGETDQSAVRRYRVIVPYMAGLVDRVAGNTLEKVRPWSSPDDFSLGFSFLVVNSIIMALFSLLLFRLTLFYVTSPVAALIALLAMLTCRWTSYFAGLPLVDSLYLLVIASSLLGIKGGYRGLIIFSIIAGPWAKESFIFVAPLIFLFAPLSRYKQAGWFALSGLLVFGFRFIMDWSAGNSFTESFIADTGHFAYITASAGRLLSFHGLYEIMSVFGIWVLLFIPLFVIKGLYRKIAGSLERYIWWYLPAVLIQMLLSTDIARMFYLVMPVLVIVYAMIIENLGIIQKISAGLPNSETR